MTRPKSAAALCCAALSCAAAAAGGGGASAFVPGTAPPPFGRRADRGAATFSAGAAAASVLSSRNNNGLPSSGPSALCGGGSSRRRQRRLALGMAAAEGRGDGGNSSDAPDDADSSSADNEQSKRKPLRTEKDSSDVSPTDAERYERTYRIAQKRAEIESLLTGPDPPFDAESELAKIPGGVHPPVSMEDDSPEAELERKTSELERQLYDAVEKGEWDVAQVKRDELGKEYLDDCGAVLQANLRFYRAFSSKDYAEMSKLWLHDASVLCVHPSHAPLVGASAVLGSWKRMFDTSGGVNGGSSGAFRRNVVEPTRVRLSMRGATAILTCDEEVYTRRFVRGERRKTELVNKLTATNVFRKVDGRWRMVHHHAAWHAESDAAKRALGSRGTTGAAGGKSRSPPKTVPGGGGSPSGKSEHQGPGSVESSRGIPDHEGITGKGYGEKSDKKSGGGGGADSDDPFSALDGLSSLGGLGGLGGGGSLNPDGSNGPVRRVFMGSLSDLLNGGLSDLLSSGSGSSSDKIIDAKGGKGDDDEDDDGPSIIRFFSEDDDHDEDQDEDDEDSDVSIQFVQKGPDGKGATIIRSVKKVDDDDDDDSNGGASVVSGKDGAIDAAEVSAGVGGSPSGGAGAGGGGAPKDALRQNCISALRRLAVQGAISAKQKRVLLTDIIMCSARGEFSMVEVAYELLCGECANDDDAVKNGCVPEERSVAEEEFADQCRVFASSLPESPPYSPAR